jgi:hypothetical protein
MDFRWYGWVIRRREIHIDQDGREFVWRVRGTDDKSTDQVDAVFVGSDEDPFLRGEERLQNIVSVQNDPSFRLEQRRRAPGSDPRRNSCSLFILEENDFSGFWAVLP